MFGGAPPGSNSNTSNIVAELSIILNMQLLLFLHLILLGGLNRTPRCFGRAEAPKSCVHLASNHTSSSSIRVCSFESDWWFLSV